MIVELNSNDEAILQRALETGDFDGPQAVLHEALCLLETESARSSAIQKELDQKLQDGLNSGEAIPVDADYWTQLRTELEARRGAGSGSCRWLSDPPRGRISYSMRGSTTGQGVTMSLAAHLH